MKSALLYYARHMLLSILAGLVLAITCYWLAKLLKLPHLGDFGVIAGLFLAGMQMGKAQRLDEQKTVLDRVTVQLPGFHASPADIALLDRVIDSLVTMHNHCIAAHRFKRHEGKTHKAVIDELRGFMGRMRGGDAKWLAHMVDSQLSLSPELSSELIKAIKDIERSHGPLQINTNYGV